MHTLIDQDTGEPFYLDTELLGIVRTLSEKMTSTTEALNDSHKMVETLKRVNENLQSQICSDEVIEII